MVRGVLNDASKSDELGNGELLPVVGGAFIAPVPSVARSAASTESTLSL
jgi:hypothetical protein